MKTIAGVLLVMIATASIPVLGQMGEPIRVLTGTPVLPAFPDSTRLRYRDFGWGRVLYHDGKQSELHLFNYDMLLEDILMIRNEGDTVVFDEQNLIKLVQFNNATYLRASNFGRAKVRRKPYFEIVGKADDLLLGVRNTYLFTNKKQRVDPGQSPYADYTASATAVRFNGRSGVLSNVDFVWDRLSIYYIIDKEGNFYRLNKAVLHRFFPKYHEQIEDYLKATSTSFHSGPEIEKLFAYCASLSGK